MKRTYTTDLCSVSLARPFLPLLAESSRAAPALATWLACVDDDARVPVSAAYDFLEQATVATGDVALGLRAASLDAPDPSSVLAEAVQRAPTFGATLDLVGRYAQLLNDDLSLSLRVSADQAEVNFESRLGAPRAFVDLQVCALLTRLRPAIPTGFLRALDVSFRYDAPRGRATHHKALGRVRTHFSQAHTGLAFPRTFLDVANKRAATPGTALIVTSAEELGPPHVHAAKGHAAQLRSLVLEELPHASISAALLARKTGESVHALARRLHEENTTFAAVVDDVRRQLAEHYLVERGLTVVDTALLTGFAQFPAFGRAFQRWTGTAPALHRRASQPWHRERCERAGDGDRERQEIGLL